MSFPVFLQGPSGQQFSTYGTTAQRWPFGTQLILQDGRKFRFAQAGGTALTAGSVQQAAANLANHIDVVQTAGEIAPLNQKFINLDIVTDQDFTANMYDEGFINVSDGLGEGYIYKIASHDTNTAETTTLTRFDFVAGDAIQVATGLATDLTILKNPYDGTIIYPTTSTQVHVGVAIKPLIISGHGWLQTRGLASVLANSTMVLGDGVFVSATTAGSVSPTTATFAVTYTRIVGFVAHAGATTEYATIFLTIDG